MWGEVALTFLLYYLFHFSCGTSSYYLQNMDLSIGLCFRDSASQQWVYYYRVLDENSIEEICIGELKIQIHIIQSVEFSESNIQNAETIDPKQYQVIRDRVSTLLEKIEEQITSSDPLEKDEPAIGHAYRKDHTVYYVDSFIRTCDQKILYKAIESKDNKVIQFMNVAPLSLFESVDFEEIYPKCFERVSCLYSEVLA